MEFTVSKWDTVCFTGHRPEKLTQSEDEVRTALHRGIEKALKWKYKAFITGMAPGVDLWAAEEVLALRQKHPELQLYCAIPYEGFEKKWDTAWKEKYESIKNAADGVFFICPGNMRGAPVIRDKWMVDHSSLVIAFYNGGKGGTRTTVEYAEKQKIRVLNVFRAAWG